MFGGIGFMLNGNLLVGASKRGLLLRVGKDRQSQALAKPGTRQMEMRGRPMDGYIYVDPPIGPDAVRGWVDMAIAFVRTLPAKTKAKRRPTKQKRK
jgi:TfoX N-terminal domain